jgi:hypothetical protein
MIGCQKCREWMKTSNFEKTFENLDIATNNDNGKPKATVETQNRVKSVLNGLMIR